MKEFNKKVWSKFLKYKFWEIFGLGGIFGICKFLEWMSLSHYELLKKLLEYGFMSLICVSLLAMWILINWSTAKESVLLENSRARKRKEKRAKK